MNPIALIAFLVVAAIIGFGVLSYLVSNNKITGSFAKPAKAFVGTVSWMFFLGIAGLIAASLYDAADKAGWFPHSRTMSVRMPHDWLVGQFKPCSLTGSKTIAPTLTCGDYNATPHDMSVEFHGSLDSLETGKQTKWNCQRKQESIVCKAE